MRPVAGSSTQTKSAIYAATLSLLRIRIGRNCSTTPGCSPSSAGSSVATVRGGKDSIDHASNAHDDVANAAAGALTLPATQLGACGEVHAEKLAPEPYTSIIDSSRLDWQGRMVP